MEPFVEEDWKNESDSIDAERNNEPDSPFVMHLKGRRKRRSYNSDETESCNESDSDGDQSYSVPGSLSDDDTALEDPHSEETLVQFAAKPMPGCQEVQSHLFQCRKEKWKGHT